MGYLVYLFEDIFYSFADAVVFAFSLALVIKLLSIFTPLKDWGKIKDNSIAMAIVLVVIVIMYTVFTVTGWFFTYS